MTMRILAMLGVALTASAAAPVAELATGDQLPPLKGDSLSGRTAVLPQAASGRVALLMLGFTYDSRFQVEAWAKRFRQDFRAKPGITFFEIPMIGGMARMGKWFIDRGMRRGTPKADHDNVITVYGGTNAWKKRVGFHDPTAAYLILIDQRGRVAWRSAGSLDEERYSALSSEVSRLLAAN
jgi:ATP10 protein